MVNELLLKAEELFFKYGVRSVSMDDISRELGVSKKTLYLHVESKADLVKKATEEWLKSDLESCLAILSDKKNAIDEMIELGRHVVDLLKGLNPSFVYDLKKYYPEVWKLHEDYRWQNIAPALHQNMLKGIEQGMFRADVNVEMISRLYIGKVDIMLSSSIFPSEKFKLVELYAEFLKYHIHGIASAKGAKRLEKILSSNKRAENGA